MRDGELVGLARLRPASCRTAGSRRWGRSRTRRRRGLRARSRLPRCRGSRTRTPPVLDDGQRADEAGRARALRPRGQPRLDVGESLADRWRRATRKRAECTPGSPSSASIDQARVLGHRQDAGPAVPRAAATATRAVVVLGLQARVGFERVAGLARARPRPGPSRSVSSDTGTPRSRRANLARLVRVGGGDEQGDGSRVTARAARCYFWPRYWPTRPRCSATSWRMPVSARSSRRLSASRPNGSASAVPCSSM